MRELEVVEKVIDICSKGLTDVIFAKDEEAVLDIAKREEIEITKLIEEYPDLKDTIIQTHMDCVSFSMATMLDVMFANV